MRCFWHLVLIGEFPLKISPKSLVMHLICGSDIHVDLRKPMGQRAKINTDGEIGRVKDESKWERSTFIYLYILYIPEISPRIIRKWKKQ